jgi:integrase
MGKKKATTVKVKLRSKPITGGRQSLYLDFYPAIPHPETGEPTRREFLGMYLLDKPKHPADKLHNKETDSLAQHIRQRKEMELNKGEIYTVLERQALKKQQDEMKRGQRDFVAYFRELADKRKGSNNDNWLSALHYLESFTGGTLRFADLSQKWCADFREYLTGAKSRNRSTTLSVNTTVSYFNKLKAALKQAYKDGLLTEEIGRKVKGIKPAESQRHFLTLEELNALARTPCGHPLMKRAGLFSALTGLRHSDIQKLTWAEVGHSAATGHYLQFRQQKTGGAEVMPISEQAAALLGERGKPTERPFEGLTYGANHNRHLFVWLGTAGITKHITFHCFRHTYATLLLSKGADMATVSKMLGHREQKTTAIYAKVIDQSKRKAADLIQLDLEG